MVITMEKMKENEFLQLVLGALRKNLTGQAEIKAVKPVRDPRLRADYLLRIAIQGKEIRYYAEIKANVTKADKLLAMMRKGEFDYPLLLVTKYINTQLADELKQNGTEFIDTAGNAFINQPPLYIFVKGNKPDIVKTPPPKRTFKPAGLRVIYAFLCNPGLENKTYREIAAEADVALGTVDWIMKELKGLGFLLDMGKRGQRLIQRENLLQRWVTAYPEQLRPKLTLGRFRGEYDWWRQKTLDPLKAQWGGEVAAAKLTQYLQPQIITIYTTPQQLDQLLIENRLKRDQTGDVEILKRFWKQAEIWKYEDLIHPILIYADLLATGNERNIETANMIYDQHIIQLIRED
ncbi:MAG: hypothetical protein COZ69_15745 [Deltaproteobacteria bacterium CG_4_8_14_3_um_filter_45_9]|nr:MAG: hypothetical protein COS40_08575 [Deltaproteobacteria bacterium CG03_land_8_20_14_0_80_45_14]PIX21265.1 MAG: hypothetical protein COZ69_15745 [Deltaproteobacteria bacterium CG_4_8_14_3_um_filter_45_9]